MEALNTLVLAIIGLVVAALNATVAIVGLLGLRQSRANAEIAQKTNTAMTLLEKNTNSMKDALVKLTGEEALARGREEARVEGEAKAATLAEGARSAGGGTPVGGTVPPASIEGVIDAAKETVQSAEATVRAAVAGVEK